MPRVIDNCLTMLSRIVIAATAVKLFISRNGRQNGSNVAQGL
jgi:hypothetical protein